MSVPGNETHTASHATLLRNPPKTLGTLPPAPCPEPRHPCPEPCRLPLRHTQQLPVHSRLASKCLCYKMTAPSHCFGLLIHCRHCRPCSRHLEPTARRSRLVSAPARQAHPRGAEWAAQWAAATLFWLASEHCWLGGTSLCQWLWAAHSPGLSGSCPCGHVQQHPCLEPSPVDAPPLLLQQPSSL